MASNGVSSHDLPSDGPSIRTALNYSSPPTDGQQGYYFVYESHAKEQGRPLTNIGQKGHDCDIRDLRGCNEGLSLDVHGFRFVEMGRSKEERFEDDEKVKEGPYTAECEECVDLELAFVRFRTADTDAKRVVIFDYTIRRQGGVEGPLKRQPVPKVHVDQSRAAAERRVRLHCPSDAEELLRGRFRIVNLWRPLIEGSPVVDIPLALADYRTIADSDFFDVQRIAPERTGETLGVKHSEQHRWYYLSDQRHEEATLIKCFDSNSTKAILTPHTAFKLPGDPPAGYKPRASIEARALLFG